MLQIIMKPIDIHKTDRKGFYYPIEGEASLGMPWAIYLDTNNPSHSEMPSLLSC